MADLMARMKATQIVPNSLALWGLGQMGIAVQGPDAVLYIDPCLSDIVEKEAGSFWARAYPTPIEPEKVTNASYYLVSHEHMDHLDTETASGVAKASSQVKFVAPKWCQSLFAEIDIADDRVIYPKALEAITLPGTSIKITAVPSAHYEKEYDAEKGYRWIGFLIEWNGVTFYHSGDTIIYDGYIETLKSLPKADIVMIPVNGRDYFRDQKDIVGNLHPREAALLATEVGWDTVIAGHNDMYVNNTIPMGHITEAFANFAPRQKLKILQPGELCYYVK